MSTDWHVCDILQWLAEDGQNDNEAGPEIQRLRQEVWKLRRRPSPVPAAELRDAMNRGPGEAGPYPLRAIERKLAVPVLMCKWNFDVEPKELRLRVVLLCGSQDGSCHAVGYRYETPEQAEDHAMHHVQPITSLDGPGGTPLPGLPALTPDWGPTIPLAAQNPLDLLVCTILSLYGKSVLPSMSSAVGNVFTSSLARLR